LAQTPRVFKSLEVGAKPDVVRRIAANSRRLWCNSGMLLNSVLTFKWMDTLGNPLLA